MTSHQVVCQHALGRFHGRFPTSYAARRTSPSPNPSRHPPAATA